MPSLTDYQKRQLLASRGLSPNEWDIDESLTPVPREEPISLEQPSTAPRTNFTTTPRFSAPQAFGVSALQEAPSAIGGGLGGGLGLAGGTALATALAPETMGASFLIPLLTSLAGAFTGSAATRKVQQAVEPEQWQKAAEQAQQEHPTASMLGGLSTIPLSGFNPNPRNVVKALGTGGRMLTGFPESDPNALANLLNVATGSAIGAGANVAEQVGSPQPFDPLAVLKAGGIGALFNNPNAIGRRLGFHQPNIPDLHEQLAGGLEQGIPQSEQIQQQPTTTPTTTLQPSPIGMPMGMNSLDVINRLTSSGIMQKGPKGKENFVPGKSAEESAMDMAAAMQQGQEPIPRQAAFEASTVPEGERLSAYQIQQLVRKKDFEQAQAQKAEQDLMEQRNAKAELDRQEAAQLASENAARALDLQQNLQPKLVPREQPKPIATTELGKEIMPDYTGVTEHENIQAAKESASDLAARKIEGFTGDKYSTESELPSYSKAWWMDKEGKLEQVLFHHQKLRDMGLASHDYESLFSKGYARVIEHNRTKDIYVDNGKRSFNYKQLQSLKNLAIENEVKVERGDKYKTLFDPAEDKFSNITPIRTKEQTDLLDANKGLTPNQHWFDILKKWTEVTKGLKVDDTGTITDSKGREVAGQTILEKGVPQLIKLSSTKKGADTPIHEMYHAFVAALRKSPREQDQKLVSKYDKLLSTSEDYKTWETNRDNAGLDSSPEEYQATNAGFEFIKRHLNMEGETPIKKWWNDFNSYIKTRFTKHATPEDFQRLLDYRLTNEQRSIPSYFGRTTTPVGSAIQAKSQEQSELSLGKEDKFSRMRAATENPEIGKRAEAQVRKEMLDEIQQKSKPGDIEEKFSTESELIPSHHESVKTLIDTAVAKTDDASIKPVDADELHGILQKKIDWKKMPKIEEYINRKTFDNLDPEDWQHVSDLYNQYQNAPKESATPKAPLETPKVEAKKVEAQPKSTEKKLPTEKKWISEKQVREPASFKHEAVRWAPDEVKFGRLSEGEVNKIKNSKFPDIEAKKLRDEYSFLNEFTQQMRAGGLSHRPKYEDAITRMAHIKSLYKEIAGAHENITPQELKYSSESFLPQFIRPEIEKVRNLENPEAPKVADAMENYYELRRKYLGSLTNDFLGKILPTIPKANLKEQFFQNTPEMQQVVNRRFDLQDKGYSNITLSPAAKKIDDILSANLQKSLDLKNSFPKLPKTFKGDPEYLPQIPSRKTLDTLLNHSGTPEARKLIQDWHDYYINTLGKTKAESDAALKVFKAGYEKQESNLAEQFGPIDKSAGLGIPRSWRETGLVDIMSRFNNRYGRRIAYHEAMETKPDVMDALSNSETGIGAADVVKNVTDDISGVRENYEAKRTAISGIVRAAMLGPLTGAKDFVSNFTLGMQHQTLPQSVMSAVKAISEIGTNIKESFEAGVNRHNISALEMGEGGVEDWTNALRRIRDVISVAQGRNFLEKITRGIAYGQGKFLAMDNLWAAHKVQLSRQGKDFLDNFGPDNWRDYAKKGEFPPDVLMETAAKYVESVQGTYDFRGLPSIATKGTLAPYLALAKWNIEKLNNFDKYVISPARNGNIQPLLMSTLGMVIGGEAVNQLVQVVTKRKEKTPNYQELAAISEEPDGKLGQAVLYKLAGLVSYSGMGGLVGDLSKAGMDVWFKNRPQTYNNPLITGAESIGQNIVDAAEAFHNGDLNIGADVLSQVLEDFFQSYRIGLANIGPEKKQDIEQANRLRDLKVFKTTSGMPVSDVGSDRPNPFLNKDIKEFKKTSNIQDAVERLPNLISKAFDKSNGDPEILRNELQKIKENSYQTMPSPDNMPYAFIRYLTYLQKTEGVDKANETLMDYLTRNAINKTKSELVPSI